MLRKSTLREIKNSLGRYLAILAIVALGVGFFSGIKVTREAMIKTADEYLADHDFFDYKVVSTLGFKEKDVKALAKESYIGSAEGSVSTDVLYSIDGEADRVLMMHSITDRVKELSLKSGRMPKADDECVVDYRLVDDDAVGQKIVISSENEKDTRKMFKYKEYTITGIVISPYYMNFERGSTSLGSGSVAGFAYINRGGFDTDYFTEIFLGLKDHYSIYSDEYNDLVDATEDKLQTAADKRSDLRYQKIIKDAKEKLSDGQKEYDENYDKYLSEKADAEQKLADSYQKIIDGKNTLAQEKKNLDAKEKELKASKAKVEAGLSKVAAQRKDFEANKQYMTPEQIAQTEAKLSATEKQLNGNLSKINAGLSQIDTGRRKIKEAEAEMPANLRKYNEAKAEANEKFAEAKAKLDDAKKDLDKAKREIADIKAPDTYVLDRNTNIGYACFESDSNIVDGIAKVFPIFFFLVAALVCMTTMTRMVDEQRTQIGVLKALGYSNGAVIGKYLFYSGSASFIGCVSGFLFGCWLFPLVIWKAYGMMYDFSSSLYYIINGPLAVTSLLVSLLCSMGATIMSCYAEFREVPAQLIRPKSPKDGKRILLERITFLWKKISFLYKVSFRNIFRYKKRFFMMVLGISGCTALLLTGLGVRDSIKNVVDFQYDEIQVYDYSVVFDKEMGTWRQDHFQKEAADYVDDMIFVHEGTADLLTGKTAKSVNLVASDNEHFDQFVKLHNPDGTKLNYPSAGQAVICRKLADEYDLAVGDKITLRDENMKKMELTVSGVCQNFVYNYVYVSPQTCQDQWGYRPEIKSALVNAKDGMDVYASSSKVLNMDHVATVSVNNDLRVRVSNMMKSLDYVILLVCLSAGALAFIVLYNLTNINITERIREIATIKVLGFYPKETSAYVFRENFFLTGISAVVGLLLGKWLHAFVMEQIKVDMLSFDVRITAVSYVLAVVLTFVFAAVVNLAMYYKLEKISMTESLKSIE